MKLENEELLLSYIKNEEELIQIITDSKNSFESWKQVVDMWKKVKKEIMMILIVSLMFFIFALLQELVQIFTFFFFLLAALLTFVVLSCLLIENYRPNSWLDFTSYKNIERINSFLESENSNIKISDTNIKANMFRNQKKIKYTFITDVQKKRYLLEEDNE